MEIESKLGDKLGDIGIWTFRQESNLYIAAALFRAATAMFIFSAASTIVDFQTCRIPIGSSWRQPELTRLTTVFGGWRPAGAKCQQVRDDLRF